MKSLAEQHLNFHLNRINILNKLNMAVDADFYLNISLWCVVSEFKTAFCCELNSVLLFTTLQWNETIFSPALHNYLIL